MVLYSVVSTYSRTIFHQFSSLFFLFMHEKRTHSLSNMSVVPDIMKKENEYEEEARKRKSEREN